MIVNDVTLFFSQLHVGALLVKGKASPQLMDCCYGSGVVMVTSVPHQCLVALAASTGAALCTYVTESTQVGLIFFICRFSTVSTTISWRILGTGTVILVIKRGRVI